ncbi:gfo/Idh/MocA family oxidoreductase [Virgibacillus dakarensis]|uniref:Oxidoreductase n=1 Tax=Lentibacillus populi TaxID=1827502 RepID=A0A9W5U1Y2_9BACI|nr:MULTISPECIES: Gfo/Idh/MocA family oxidoreductase [Bacillaceae]MBT2217644.1 Gfo/Idh/MocA family oxidoreductase [Virgibacillus dakarensis]MTW86687.1 gfo/Idh/MocA family oxidoreductase [Virgibacillus dakarensis]GGB62597.1 oxidoreductase [Lentibacillus populi]
MNFGTIGTSWITAAFIEAAQDVTDMRLTAVYSRSEQKAKQFAETHGACNVFTDIEEMAESEQIDCVYIASPNALHYEQALTFLNHNKHVICEKPIFSNITELEKAYQIAEKNGVFLVEAMRNVHMPNLLVLKERIEKAGQLRNVVLNYAKYSSRYDAVLNGEEPNIFSLHYSGGALVDLGVYPIAIAIFLFGKPERITYAPVLIRTGVDGSGTLVLNYSDFTCTIFCSKISTSYNPSEIQGEQGTFTIDDIGTVANIAFIDIHSGHKERIASKHEEKDMFYEIEHFVQMIKTNNQAEYKRLKQLSCDILTITEAARKENKIVYKNKQ